MCRRSQKPQNASKRVMSVVGARCPDVLHGENASSLTTIVGAPTSKISPSLTVEFYVALVHFEFSCHHNVVHHITRLLLPPFLLHYVAFSLESWTQKKQL